MRTVLKTLFDTLMKIPEFRQIAVTSILTGFLTEFKRQIEKINLDEALRQNAADKLINQVPQDNLNN